MHGVTGFDRLEHMFEHVSAVAIRDGVPSHPVTMPQMVMRGAVETVLGSFTAAEILAVLEEEPPSERTVILACAVGRRTLTANDKAALLAVWVRIESWTLAQVDKAIVAVAGSTPTPDDWGKDEAALCMRMSTVSATGRVAMARTRQGQLGGIGAALEAGILLTGQAFDLVTAVGSLSDDIAEAVVASVLPGADGTTRAELRKATSKAVIAIDPDGAASRHVAAKRDRRVRLYPAPDNMADVIVTLPAPEAETVFRALDARARRDIAQARAAALAADPTAVVPHVSLDNARADALVDWAQTQLADPDLPRAQGRRVELRVTMTLPCLLGLAEHPAYLEGYGPISPDIARELLPEGRLRRLVTDPVTGHLLDVGQTSYPPPQAMVDFVVTRDATCILRGCSRPARHCDLDHRVEFSHGGSTSSENLACLCERHHTMKHKGGWRLVTTRFGDLVFISAAGRRYPVDRESVDPSFVRGAVCSDVQGGSGVPHVPGEVDTGSRLPPPSPFSPDAHYDMDPPF